MPLYPDPHAVTLGQAANDGTLQRTVATQTPTVALTVNPTLPYVGQSCLALIGKTRWEVEEAARALDLPLRTFRKDEDPPEQTEMLRNRLNVELSDEDRVTHAWWG